VVRVALFAGEIMFIYGRQGPPKIWGKGERARLGPATTLGDIRADTDNLRGLGADEPAPSTTGTTLLTAGIVIGALYYLLTKTAEEMRPLPPSRLR